LLRALQLCDHRKRSGSQLRKRSRLAQVARPGGAFYAFVEVPPALGMTGAQFVEHAIARNVLVIPGGAFSTRDTHFRLSFAAPEAKLAEGLSVLASIMRGE